MKANRLHGARKQKRDQAVRDFEFQHPYYSQGFAHKVLFLSDFLGNWQFCLKSSNL